MQQTRELNIELACKIGLCEAVLLGYLQEQIETDPIIHDGRRWTRQTIMGLQEALKLWSLSKVRRAIISLANQGLITIQHKYNRRFAINAERLHEIMSE